MLELIPVTLKEAKAFTYAHHRHNPITPPSWRFGVGVAVDGFTLEATVDPPERGWETRPKQLDLLGTPHRPDGPKLRWSRKLRP